MSDDFLGSILDYFNYLEEYVPGVGSAVGEILIGKIPDSSIVSVYHLADAWSEAATQLGDAYQEINTLAAPILEGWRSDTAAPLFADQWFQYLEALNGSVQSLSGMADGVRQFGLQIELLKFMVAINLLLLAMTIYMLVAAAFASFGISLGGVFPAIGGAGVAIGQGAAAAARAIAGISLRVAIRALPRISTRALPTVAVRAASTVTRTTLPALVRTQLPTIVRTTLPNLIRTQLPNLVRTVLPTVGRTTANYLRNLPANLARQILPRNVIARHVADRMATQWMRSMTSRELMRQLAREAGVATLTRASLANVRNALAWRIEQQLLQNFGTRAASGLVSRSAAASVARLSESAVARQVTTAALRETAEAVSVSFGRELASYLGTRVGLGAGIMGGGNLLGQFLQIAEGNRTGFDFGEAGMYAAQGAVFGAGMWGGMGGHIAGGALAGGTFAAGVETYQHVAHGEEFDWGEVRYGAAHGAAAGAVFGAMNQAQTMRVSVPLRIGQDVAVIPDVHQPGRLGVLAQDANTGLRVAIDSSAGVVWRHGPPTAGDPTWNWAGRDGTRGEAVFVDGPGARFTDPPGGPPPPGRPQAPVAELPAGTIPRDAAPPVVPRDGGPGGPVRSGPDSGGPPPRQPAGPTSVRVTEPGSRVLEPGARGPTEPAPPERTGSPPERSPALADESTPPAVEDQPGPDRHTGSSIRPRDEVAAWEWAEQEAYQRFRADDSDVPDIANSLAGVERPGGEVGFTPDEVGQVKRHLMVDEHLLDDFEGGLVRGRFDASPDIAEAWIRLREGRHVDADIILLEHELAESNYLRANPDATYREAHHAANQIHNWEALRPERTGENLDTSWGREYADGDPAGLQEGPGRQTGGGVHLRSFDGDGPQPGHREAVPERPTPGREPEQRLRGGVHEDPALPPEQVPLAGDGVVRGVAPDPGDVAITGARIRPVDEIGAVRWADEAYGRFRASDGDVVDIADNLATVDRPNGEIGFAPAEIRQVKRHVMFEEHLLDDYQGGHVRNRFAPDEDMAEAWIRLREGRHLDADIILLEHELAESSYLRTHPEATYREAHTHANESYNWNRIKPDRTGEDLDVLWREERLDGDTSGLSEGSGGPTGGGVHLRGLGEPGAPTGGREGVPAGEAARRESGQGLHQDIPEDPAVLSARGELAGDGVVLGVGEEAPLAGLEVGPADPPVLGADRVTFGEVAQVEPAPPRPMTPEAVDRILHDPATPEPLLQWTRDHLAVRGEGGSFTPRSASEIAVTLARLEQDASQAVAGHPGRLHILAFDGGGPGPGHPGAMERLSVELGGLGDRVVLRVPDVPSTTLAPGVEVRGADPLPGITGRLSPLLRTDGLPADVDVLLGYRDTAGIADVRRDAYPDATVVQLLDTVPTDPDHVAVLARADLVIAVGPDVARQLPEMFDRLGLDLPPPVHEIPTGPDVSPGETARELHRTVSGLGEGVARVDDATWSRELSTREVALRGAGEVPAQGPPRVMTTFVAWSSEGGGGATANRELAATFAAVGAEVYARVPTIGPSPHGPVFTDPGTGVHVVGTNQVWGVVDTNGLPDRRALIMLLDNLPPHVDVVVGHSRFSGGAAAWLAEHVYPDAEYVHVLHSLPEQLDALRGSPLEGLQHAQTERTLMSGADLVAGVGPLLAQEAARLNAPPPPPVHTMISDMPPLPGDPPPRPPDRSGFEILIQGRVGDPLKGVEFAARVVAALRAEGIDVRLTTRGAAAGEAEGQARRLTEIAGGEVTVRVRTTDARELHQDLLGADLVLMPSVHEGFGLVASEAARAGVPVLVGEGTGAGMFFGDPVYVPAALGEDATVRDGVTVQAVWDALQASSDPAEAVAQLDQRRLAVWVEHLKRAVESLEAQRQRALDLREFLGDRYPLGSAARGLLDALHGGEPGGVAAPPTVPGGGHGGGTATAGSVVAPSPHPAAVSPVLRSETKPEPDHGAAAPRGLPPQ